MTDTVPQSSRGRDSNRIFRPCFALFLFASLLSTVCSQPRLKVETATSYQPGDQIDKGTFVLDREMQKHPLLSLVEPDTKVVVLIIFGGGMKQIPGPDYRGTLWCEDSFDDLAVQRALVQAFKNQPVQFIPVAVPPVYHLPLYGWTEEDFLAQPDETSADYRAAVQAFISATEREAATGMLPFAGIYYDPKFRLAQNQKERKLGPEFGTIYDWQGKLKWSLDPRKYGTPTIWLLDATGRVLTEPLLGNDYDSDPPQIRYGFKEAFELISRLMKEESSSSKH